MELIASASATDDTTYHYRYGKDKPGFGGAAFPIIPDKTIGTSLPTGCGPYKVVSNESGKSLELAANDNWWKRTPYLSKISVKGIQDSDTALASMDVNLVDLGIPFVDGFRV
ncbi:MAG: ABC transporter substrate-binding protein [Christensenellales bacterium]